MSTYKDAKNCFKKSKYKRMPIFYLKFYTNFSFLLGCLGKTDLAFVVDSSGSVTREGFERAKDFVWQVVRHFSLQGEKTQVGVVRYSTRAELVIRFKQFSDKQRLREAINNIQYTEGGTRTAEALRLALWKLFSIRGGTREGVSTQSSQILLTLNA